MYEWQKNISFKRKQYTVASQTDYYLESNPVEFACKEPIKKNSTYRIYYSNLTCDFATVEIFGLNLRVEVSKNGTNLDSAINIGFSTLATANEMYKITCAPVIVNVTPGDLIMLNAYTQNASATVTIKAYNGRATNITIEEV